ncbi:MAG: hypothetical protein DRQ44_04250 [Gammaproteobacteria bacterium]|nr:MAG: hypothetical protein DRQ44_04250 [Gammaproteobacteria bacterium]
MSFQLLTTPSSIGRVLDSGFKLFTSSFKSVLTLLALSAVISVIMQYAMMVIMVPDQPFTTQEQSMEYMSQIMPVLMVVGIIFWIFSIAIYNAVLARVGQHAMNDDGDLTDAIVIGVKKLLPVVLAMVLYMIAISLGSILLLIPGLILMLTLIFFQILIVTEDAGIIESLKTSHRLVWGNYWRTAAVIMIPIFIIYALVIVVALISGVMMAMDAETMADPAAAMDFGLIEAFSAALPAFLISLMYSMYIVQVNDLKLRKSGDDLQQRLQ